MVNGFKFNPLETVLTGEERKTADNPHARIYHFEKFSEEESRYHHTGWPIRLGFDEDTGTNGLAVAFGWYSAPSFFKSIIEHGSNFYVAAYDYARETAWTLLITIHALAKALPATQPIDIFCHSLGSAVVIRALALAAEQSNNLSLLSRIGRVIILGGSEYSDEGRLLHSRLIDREQKKTLNNADLSIYNIVSKENAVLDLLGENFGPKSLFTKESVVGRYGLRTEAFKKFWLDIQIDNASVQGWLAEKPRNLSIIGDAPRIWDHWVYYTHPGNMEFYKQILRNRKQWEISAVRQIGFPEGVMDTRIL